MGNKKELRSRLKQARLEMPKADRTLKSRAIVEKLKTAADWGQVKTLHYFEPIDGLAEPDIREFINYLEDNFAHIKLFTPRKLESEWQLVAVKGGRPPGQFDAVIVPALGFDPKTLHRIGYGGGYYDKFLATQPEVQKIGVCFELGKIPSLPVEPHDIKLDSVATEDNLY